MKHVRRQQVASVTVARKDDSRVHESTTFLGAAALVLALLACESAAVRAEEFVWSSGMSGAAASKIDPRLLLARSMPRDDEGLLRRIGDHVAMVGRSAIDLTFPVVIKTTLSDAELAELGAPPDTRTGELVTSRIRERDLERVASHPGVIAIEGAYYVHSTLDVSTVETRANEVNGSGSGTQYTGDGVIYGLIDDGIDITHQDFKNPQGQSRILFAWDQFAAGNGQGTGFNYGREFTKAQIDNGQASAFTNEGGHGSHVAGISVGDGSDGGSFRGIAWEADIIAVVNVPNDLFLYGGGSPAWGGAPTTTGAIDGLSYLETKARSLSRPLVVNQSQGVTMGPHDGTTLFETAYDDMIQQQDIIVAVAAGNDQDADWHGRTAVNSGGTSTFRMIHDDSQGAGGPLPFISFELWYDASRQFNYTLINPSGQSISIPASTGNNVPGDVFPAQADTAFFYATTSHPVNGQGNLAIFMQNRTLGIQGGQWQIQVNSESGSSGTVHFYAERNQFNFKVVNPDLTSIVAMPGSATNVITVASHNTRFTWPNNNGTGTIDDGPSNPLNEITTFSSNGPRRDGAQKPDISAPGKWIVSALSNQHQTNAFFITPDGNHHALQGTSMACPHVAGAIALMLEKDPSLTFTQVKQILQQTARHDQFTGSGWQPDFGHGKLDVAAAVAAVQGSGGNCTTSSGDANLNGAVNVLDVVATVNHIIGQTTLNTEQQACADVTGDETITVNDVNGIVGVILSPGLARMAPNAEPLEIAWGEAFEETSYQLVLDPAHVAGIQLSFLLPRGYELTGDPILHGSTTVSLSWSETMRLHTLLAYDTSGNGLAAGSSPLVLELPVTRTWDGGQDMSAFTVSRLVLSDPTGRTLTLAPEPTLEPAPSETGGLRTYLTSMTPNPMREITQVNYRLDAHGPVRIDVYDAEGRRVRNLWNGSQMSGDHTLPWDGRNDEGVQVSAGVYFVRLDDGRGGDGEKILVVR